MAKKSIKKAKSRFRPVTFRMPQERYDLLEAVARERGTDLSSVLNTLIADAVPALGDWLVRRLKAASPQAEPYRKVMRVMLEEDLPLDYAAAFLTAVDKAARAPTGERQAIIEAETKKLVPFFPEGKEDFRKQMLRVRAMFQALAEDEP